MVQKFNSYKTASSISNASKRKTKFTYGWRIYDDEYGKLFDCMYLFVYFKLNDNFTYFHMYSLTVF